MAPNKCVIIVATVLLVISFRIGSIVHKVADTPKPVEIISLRAEKNETISEGFELAYIESNGFFTDIPNDSWKRIKRRAHAMQPNYLDDPFINRPASHWFQMNYEPEFSCQFEDRLGVKGDGGKWVCDPHRIEAKGKECLVYSVGSNGVASFENDVLRRISADCEVHVFDFGNFAEKVAQETNHNRHVHYHQFGLSTTTNSMYKTLLETVHLLNHVNRTIDIFKIDCEGCELETYQQWLDAPVRLQQILVEIHSDELGKMKMPQSPQMFNALHDYGYVITHKEPSIQWGAGNNVEYVFLLLSPEFWKGGTS